MARRVLLIPSGLSVPDRQLQITGSRLINLGRAIWPLYHNRLFISSMNGSARESTDNSRCSGAP